MRSNCSAEIAATEENGFEAVLNTENCADFILKLFHIVAVALLPESAEAVKILPNLRCGQAHALRQLF